MVSDGVRSGWRVLTDEEVDSLPGDKQALSVITPGDIAMAGRGDDARE